MKSLLFPIFLILVPSYAPASGTIIGNGRACREGSIESFNESRGEGEPSSVVSFVCRNGRMQSLAPAAKPAASRGCVEGDKQHWTEETANGLVNQAYVCHGGRYVPVTAQ